MIKRVIIIVSLAVVLNSCLDKVLGNRYVKSVKYSQRHLELWYNIEGLFNHFPKSISNNAVFDMQSLIPVDMDRYPEKNWKSYLCLIMEMGNESQEFYPDTFIYKTDYKSLNFIIDPSFRYYLYYDTLKLRNVVQLDACPIPYFEDYDFGLGEERIDFITDDGFEWVSDRFNVPKDLVVFVLKAGYGDYWKIKCEGERPETLGDWKNGYSSGVAISKEHNMAVYWMMTW